MQSHSEVLGVSISTHKFGGGVRHTIQPLTRRKVISWEGWRGEEEEMKIWGREASAEPCSRTVREWRSGWAEGGCCTALSALWRVVIPINFPFLYILSFNLFSSVFIFLLVELWWRGRRQIPQFHLCEKTHGAWYSRNLTGALSALSWAAGHAMDYILWEAWSLPASPSFCSQTWETSMAAENALLGLRQQEAQSKHYLCRGLPWNASC